MSVCADSIALRIYFDIPSSMIWALSQSGSLWHISMWRTMAMDRLWFRTSRRCSFNLVVKPLPVSPTYDLLHGPEQGILYTTLWLSGLLVFGRVKSSTFFPDTVVTLVPAEIRQLTIVSACFEDDDTRTMTSYCAQRTTARRKSQAWL